MQPANKDAGQQDNVIADYANDLQQIEIEGYEMAVRKARNALYWAGGLIFAGEMINMFGQGLGFQPILFIIAIIEAGIFIGLAVWTKKKPYTAVVTGLIIFIVIIIIPVVAMGVAEGSTGAVKALLSGILVKVLILVNLILPLKDARALQEARKQTF